MNLTDPTLPTQGKLYPFKGMSNAKVTECLLGYRRAIYRRFLNPPCDSYWSMYSGADSGRQSVLCEETFNGLGTLILMMDFEDHERWLGLPPKLIFFPQPNTMLNKTAMVTVTFSSFLLLHLSLPLFLSLCLAAGENGKWWHSYCDEQVESSLFFLSLLTCWKTVLRLWFYKYGDGSARARFQWCIEQYSLKYFLQRLVVLKIPTQTFLVPTSDQGGSLPPRLDLGRRESAFYRIDLIKALEL